MVKSILNKRKLPEIWGMAANVSGVTGRKIRHKKHISIDQEKKEEHVMGMTMTQKILAAHAGLDSVVAGQLIEADLDLVLGNDITSPVAIHEIEKMKVDGVFHKDKIALVMDHFVPNKDIKSAEHCKCVREFACRNEITNYFDVGEMGIEHALLPEKGLTVAGDVIIGADSHTCTYGSRHGNR